jgi:hypothetical protein
LAVNIFGAFAGSACGGRDPYEDLNSLADAVADSAEIFNHDGCLVWLNAGALIPVSGTVLREIITKHVVTQRLVNHGTAEEPNWTLVYSPYEPTQK